MPHRPPLPLSPLDLTKVRLQASGDKRMIESMKKTVRTAGELYHPLLSSHPPIHTLPPLSPRVLRSTGRDSHSHGVIH
jgi:hypothetical protein